MIRAGAVPSSGSNAQALPDMRATLDWSYAQAGLMNTANAAGYLLGALSSPWASRLIGPYSVSRMAWPWE